MQMCSWWPRGDRAEADGVHTGSLLKSRVQNDDPADASLETSFRRKVHLLSAAEEGDKKIVEK